MKSYSRSHLTDQALLRNAAVNLTQTCAATAELLADLAEIDARKLYLPAAHPSLFAYCVGELHLSEDAAYKRIQAARAARRFPAIFPAVAEGRLHLAAACLLAPHLAPENADELLAAATHQTKAQIEQLLAERFPRPEVVARVRELVPGRVAEGLQLVAERAGEECQLAPGQVEASAPARIEALAPATPRPKVAPVAPRRFAVQFTMSQEAHDKLRYAQQLLGHSVPSGDIAAVFERALEVLIPQLERRKFAATARPRPGQRHASANPRHIPAAVKRVAWERDGGQCTFVSEAGHRCPARTRLEFDHVEPVARGGRASVGGIRLRCRAHNQYAAECAFGTAFMSHKRREARRAAAARADQQAEDRDVAPWLRQLGFSADEVRRAAARCEAVPAAPLEERVRLAISFLRPLHRSKVPPGLSSGNA